MKIEIEHEGSCLMQRAEADDGSSATPWRKGRSVVVPVGSNAAPWISRAGALLFHLISKLYERSSLIVTTSYGPSSRRQQRIKQHDDQQ
jgi:hypothetical protein